MSNEFFIHQKLLDAWNKGKRFTVAYGGRGSGKSLQMGALCIMYVLMNPKSRVLCVRGTQNRISESSLQVLKDIIEMMGISQYFKITENTLTCNNGSEFLFYGAKSYFSFKSLQRIGLCWFDEATEGSDPCWEVLEPSIREPGSRFLISFNPERKEDWVYKTFVDPGKHPEAEVVELNYMDNPYLPDVLQKQIDYDKSNLLKFEHVWLGKLRAAIEGALWKPEWITYLSEDQQDSLLSNKFADLEEIVISVDPSASSKKTSDPCGLVAVGKYKRSNKFLIIDDQTAILSPNDWATRAIAMYDKYDADRIVYESNQGGDMVKTIINQIRQNIRVIPIHASKSKTTRAEPIAALYEQGLVQHYRKFSNLEYEYLTYVAGSPKSPNSLDASVHGITHLYKKNNVEGLVPSNDNFRF